MRRKTPEVKEKKTSAQGMPSRMLSPKRARTCLSLWPFLFCRRISRTMAPSITKLKRNTRQKKPRFTTLWIMGLVIQHLEGGERAEGYAVSSQRDLSWTGWGKHKAAVQTQRPA